jgi:NhaP-type Na+/H+ or K+/H+ antiporter
MVRNARAGDARDRNRPACRFPQRDLIVLTAFAVVLATLVVQGLTLAPLVRLLGLDDEDGLAAELAATRADLVSTALSSLENDQGPVADHWRFAFDSIRLSVAPGGDPSRLNDRRRLGLKAMRRQRERLEQLRLEQRIGPDAFAILQEELDFAEVALSTECERQIAES